MAGHVGFVDSDPARTAARSLRDAVHQMMSHGAQRSFWWNLYAHLAGPHDELCTVGSCKVSDKGAEEKEFAPVPGDADTKLITDFYAALFSAVDLKQSDLSLDYWQTVFVHFAWDAGGMAAIHFAHLVPDEIEPSVPPKKDEASVTRRTKARTLNLR